MNIIIPITVTVLAIIMIIVILSLKKQSAGTKCIEIIGSVVIPIVLWMFPISQLSPPPTPESTPTPYVEAVPTPTPEPTPYVEPTFMQRTSEQFNYTIDIPTDFIYEGADEQDAEDDFNYTSPDKRVNIVFIARAANELPENFTIESFKTSYFGTILYEDDQIKNDGWYVISVKTPDGFFRYRKCIYTDGIARMYTFSFPADQEDKYLKNFDYVSHIEKSFTKLHHD